MRVHLLRHGESASNAYREGVALPTERGDRLTDLGRRQALEAAGHLRSVGADRVLTSPLGRARETAEIVAGELGLEVEVIDELQELRESEGYGELDPDEQKLRRWSTWMTERGSDPDFSYRGGESFNEIRARVRRLQGLLVARSEERILGVSHGILLRFLLVECLLGGEFRAEQVMRLWQLGTVNCGVSVFEHAAPDGVINPALDRWRCLSWMARPWDPI